MSILLDSKNKAETCFEGSLEFEKHFILHTHGLLPNTNIYKREQNGVTTCLLQHEVFAAK